MMADANAIYKRVVQKHTAEYGRESNQVNAELGMKILSACILAEAITNSSEKIAQAIENLGKDLKVE